MPRNHEWEATKRARSARKGHSAAEHLMWQQLRGSRTGFRFRREHPIGQFRLDFYWPEAKLCVEMDGEQHEKTRDAARDAALAELGIITYRVPNLEFFLLTSKPYQDHLREIVRVCEERTGRQAFDWKQAQNQTKA